MMGNSAEFRDCFVPALSEIGDCKGHGLLSLLKPGKGCHTPWVRS